MSGKLLAYWHIHHEQLAEFATEPIENRIQYIKGEKPEREIETRLRLLKPMSAKAKKLLEVRNAARVEADKVRNAVWLQADNPLEAIHRIECPDCPWDGRTIFPTEER